jgi:hypothetical protein
MSTIGWGLDGVMAKFLNVKQLLRADADFVRALSGVA